MPVDQLIKVLIVEDNEITRGGLQLTINSFAGLEVIGTAADGLAGVDLAVKLAPNIVVVDIGLPGVDGIEVTRRIKASRPEVRVITMSTQDTDDVLYAALSAGADGYCIKEISASQLEMALKSVANGAAWLDPAVSSRVLSAIASGVPPVVPDIAKAVRPESPLSQREADVLRLVIEGYSNQEIADRLGLSVETIKTHMRHIMEKLSVTDRTQAAVKAMRQGFI
jgi:DNA-binding NarL/FixJ family response regulator